MTTAEKSGCFGWLFGIRGRTQNRNNSNENAFPYHLSGRFLSPAETEFHRVLRQMMGDKMLVFAKISLKEFIAVDSSNYTYHNKIDRKHVDFLVCDTVSLHPVFAIELDDSSHTRPDRAQRDVFVEQVLNAANLPLVRVPVRQSYDSSELGALFKNALEKRAIREKAEQTESQNPPLCPKHHIPMVLRTARHGNNVGEKFWGCKHYPDCKEIIRITTSAGV